METAKPAKNRRGWLIVALGLSPLGLALLWCRFVDPEAFGAFALGWTVTIFLGGLVVGSYLLRKLGAMKHPVAAALVILAGTIIGLVLAFIATALGAVVMFGDSDEASSGITLVFMLFAPIALLTGVVCAVRKFAEIRRRNNVGA